MYLKTELQWNIVIRPESLYPDLESLKYAIVVQLMDDFAKMKASEDIGYHLVVITMNKIEAGNVCQHSRQVNFPVTFTAISFKMFTGEILEHEVHKVLKERVILRCGPMELLFLGCERMPNYHYVDGENLVFLNEDMSKIEKGVKVCFVVTSTKWMQEGKEFQALVNIRGDYLGPAG